VLCPFLTSAHTSINARFLVFRALSWLMAMLRRIFSRFGSSKKSTGLNHREHAPISRWRGPAVNRAPARSFPAVGLIRARPHQAVHF